MISYLSKAISYQQAFNALRDEIERHPTWRARFPTVRKTRT